MSVSPKTHSEDSYRIACRVADPTALLQIMSADIWDEKDALLQYPAWVVKCGQKVARAHFPKAYEASNPNITNAYKIGLALGMMQAGESKIAGLAEDLKLGASTVPTAAQLEGVSTLIYGMDSGATLPKDGSSLIPIEILADIEKFKEEMNLEAKGNFYAGISDAHLMMSGKNASTSATVRYTTMLIYWRLVDQLDSMEKLHEFLTKIHGANIVGTDIKGTRQLCHRIGKSFQPPGRPKLPQAPRRLR